MLRENPRSRPNIYQVLREGCLMRGREVPIKDVSSAYIIAQIIQIPGLNEVIADLLGTRTERTNWGRKAACFQPERTEHTWNRCCIFSSSNTANSGVTRDYAYETRQANHYQPRFSSTSAKRQPISHEGHKWRPFCCSGLQGQQASPGGRDLFEVSHPRSVLTATRPRHEV